LEKRKPALCAIIISIRVSVLPAFVRVGSVLRFLGALGRFPGAAGGGFDQGPSGWIEPKTKCRTEHYRAPEFSLLISFRRKPQPQSLGQRRKVAVERRTHPVSPRIGLLNGESIGEVSDDNSRHGDKQQCQASSGKDRRSDSTVPPYGVENTKSEKPCRDRRQSDGIEYEVHQCIDLCSCIPDICPEILRRYRAQVVPKRHAVGVVNVFRILLECEYRIAEPGR